MGNAPLFIPRSTLLALDPPPQYTSKLRGCAPPFYPPYIAPPRPNTQPLFDVVGATPLQHSPSPLHLLAWERMLVNYPGDLPQLISGIPRNGTQLGYKGPAQFILSKNLIWTGLGGTATEDKVGAVLKEGRVVVASPSPPY